MVDKGHLTEAWNKTSKCNTQLLRRQCKYSFFYTGSRRLKLQFVMPSLIKLLISFWPINILWHCINQPNFGRRNINVGTFTFLGGAMGEMKVAQFSLLYPLTAPQFTSSFTFKSEAPVRSQNGAGIKPISTAEAGTVGNSLPLSF